MLHCLRLSSALAYRNAMLFKKSTIHRTTSWGIATLLNSFVRVFASFSYYSVLGFSPLQLTCKEYFKFSLIEETKLF